MTVSTGSIFKEKPQQQMFKSAHTFKESKTIKRLEANAKYMLDIQDTINFSLERIYERMRELENDGMTRCSEHIFLSNLYRDLSKVL